MIYLLAQELPRNVEKPLPAHSLHHFDSAGVYIHPASVPQMRGTSAALPCCNSVAVRPVDLFRNPSFAAQEANVHVLARDSNLSGNYLSLVTKSIFLFNSCRSFRLFAVSISCAARTVVQSLEHFMVLISRNQYLMQLCLYYRDLFRIVLLMYCVPQENPRVVSYVAFMRAVRNMILKHDFLTLVTCYFSKSVTLSLRTQHLLHVTKSQTAQLESLYLLRSRLPPCLCLPWLFLVLNFSSLLTSLFQKTIFNNNSRSPSVPTCLRRLALDNSGSRTVRFFAYGGGGQHTFPFEVIHPYIIAGGNVCHDYAFKFIDHVDSVGQVAYPVQQNFVHAKVPLGRLLPCLPLKLGLKIARLHHIPIGSRVSKSEFLHCFENHECATSCNLYSSVFAVVNSKAVKDRLRKRVVKLNINRFEILSEEGCSSKKDDTSCGGAVALEGRAVDDLQNGLDEVHAVDLITEPIYPLVEPFNFPPAPLDDTLSQKIISGFCEQSSPPALEEAGCAVCGILTPLSQLTRLKAIKNLLPILQASGVTKTERCKAEQPVREFKGPVLDYSCNQVCEGCRRRLREGKIPHNALANGLWLGAIPDELSCLSFVEKMLVARVRVNSCFVRVASSGLRKMASHVIAFESPVPKIYHHLPPPVEELDEVLAVLFTGPCKPTEKEFQRTPLLVRRKQVARALEWLKLNHSDYADIEIAYNELDRYPEESPPVTVEYQYSLSNKAEEGTSLFDDAPEDGVEQGDCPFVVHGLTGEQCDTKTVNALKGIALRHWNNHGGALAVSHDSQPLSIYNNPNLYPQIFPWLFPYGLGGIGGASTSLSNKAHKRHLLMYHDKRFQKDICFPFVAFSHEQVVASTTGGFLLADRKNFGVIAERLLSVNQEVLQDLAKRMSKGEAVKPTTEDEEACFQLIRDLDTVDGKVSGSITSKKYMRSEIWSMIVYLGAPVWYITLSPADNKHPICLYFADNKERLDVQLMRSEDERYRLIANNPVAGARFFHFMIKMFVKHVLGVGSDHRGLYGETSGYYGTVEQQGRLTLHLHMLLWIQGSLSPEEIRLRIQNPESAFRRKLVEYLESSHAGEFLAADRENVEEAVKVASDSKGYRNPTETLPEPPPLPCSDVCCSNCERCVLMPGWWTRFKATVNDLLMKSNIHKCSTNRNKDGSQNKARPYKGCLDNIWGRCKARFPRATFPETEIEAESGCINMKKRESWLNTFTYAVTYLFRCNTDITSLRSGTAIKGVLFYVTNYVTKPALKTHVIFDTVRSMFQKHTELIGGDDKRKHKARKLMTKIVNSLSAKMEMGSPMACMYLLGNPDHYTDQQFVPFYWRTFVREARRPWDEKDPATGEDERENSNQIHDEGATTTSKFERPEKVAIIKKNGRVIGLSPVNDYVFRPPELHSISLYDWISTYQREKLKSKKQKKNPMLHHDDAGVDSDSHGEDNRSSSPEGKNHPSSKRSSSAPKKSRQSSILNFADGHPLAKSHGARKVNKVLVPNFVGQTLPRCDLGDREFYCSTMLTLFKPWRSGFDLKKGEASWDETFLLHPFSGRQLELMKNMNIRYECLDARDDFHAQMKKGMTAIPGEWDERGGQLFQDLDQMAINDAVNGPSAESTNFDEISMSPNIGPRDRARTEIMANMRRTLSALGWADREPTLLPDDWNPELELEPISIKQTPAQWRAVVTSKRMEILEERARHRPANVSIETGSASSSFTPNDVRVIDKSYMSQSFVSKQSQETINSVSVHFELNKEQDRAFRIVANHACSPDSDQLKMNIAGMAGTGKTRVLEALVEFFKQRNESHRLTIVAPTGSAAALLKGSTYHSMFGINSDGRKTTNIQLAQVRSRLEGVKYVFLDEVSMLSCRDMYLISARLSKVLNNLDTPFGGLNMIFAGDFAQLPPVIGHEHAALYSRTVGNNAVSLREQEAAIGKALWHQVITVVILRQNMRQRTQTPEDIKFRQALANMRYKACTPADLIFLRSRVSSRLPGRSHVTEKQFRNVSIITTLNSQKDEINRLGSERYADETKQQLTHFYSIDSVSADNGDEDGEGRKVVTTARRKRTIKSDTIPNAIQEALLEQPTCANTKLIPGKLSICMGMPIMIRYNAATEMCITKGQEAVVYGWDSHKHGDKDVLDTLFVKLVNPPTPTSLDDLPQNVVPLLRTSVSSNCRLPDDTSITVTRNQVEALPNFAMTDYAAQGKTRTYNVVDLSQCRSHQGYYTALSRSSTAAGTLILTSFHPGKITGGASGALRQEFRELELLDDITRLRFEDKLPTKVAMADRRNILIDLFREYKGKNYIPSTTHVAIRWSKTDPFLEWPHATESDWRLISSSTKTTIARGSRTQAVLVPESAPASPAAPKTPQSAVPGPTIPHCPRLNLKRKRSYEIPAGTSPKPKLNLKKARFHDALATDPFSEPELRLTTTQTNVPVGTQWHNNSCAYDAVITILFNIWRDDPDATTDDWHEFRCDMLDSLSQAFHRHDSMQVVRSAPSSVSRQFTLDQIRDFFRRRLARISPQFTFGRYASVHCIFEQFLQTDDPVIVSDIVCPNGHPVDRNRLTTCNAEIILFGRPGLGLQGYLDDFTLPLHSKCPTCDRNLLRRSTFVQAPPLLAFDLSNNFDCLSLDQVLQVACQGSQISYHLRGVIYFDNQHFTERVITNTGLVWYHDGMFTGSSLVYNSNNVSSIITERAVMAIYRRESPTS